MLVEIDMIDYKLTEAVIKLHDAARLIEKTLGHCPLSKSIRQQADRISALTTTKSLAHE
jgi:hypothetical protein